MFESALIDLEARKQPQRRRWLSLPLAIVLHLVALTGFAFASYWSVDAVQEPQTVQAFIEVMLPPPPEGGHPKPPQPQPHPQATTPQPPTTPVQPHEVPDKPLAPTTPTPVEPDPGPVLDVPQDPANNGSGNGFGKGHGDDDSGTSGKGEELGGVDSAPQVLTAEMSRPVPLQRILPKYTEVARRAGVQGTVIVEAIIDEQGNATHVRILRGLPMGLDRSAMEAIQQTQFKPAMIGTRAVKVYYNLTVTFTIQR